MKRNRIRLASLVIILGLGTCAHPLSAAESRRYAPIDASFSYTPPLGWEMISAPDQRYKAARGPSDGVFTASVIVDHEEKTDSRELLKDYLERALQTLKEEMSRADIAVRVVSVEPFKSAQGKPAMRVVLDTAVGSVRVRQVQYYFEEKDEIILATCSLSLSQARRLMPVVEASMRTVVTKATEDAFQRSKARRHAIATAHARALDARCRLNLSQIGMYLTMYSMDHEDQYPPTLNSLAQYTKDTSLFVCPGTGRTPGTMDRVAQWTDYVYVPGRSAESPEKAVLLYCPAANHGGKEVGVLFLGGSVEKIDSDQFELLKAQIENH